MDADTKVFPDPLLSMVSCMVHNKQIVGLCGETKIVNNVETQIHLAFECYIFTTWLKLSGPCLVVSLVHPVVSVFVVSKHQKAILFIEFLSSKISTLWSTNLRLSIPFSTTMASSTKTSSMLSSLSLFTYLRTSSTAPTIPAMISS